MDNEQPWHPPQPQQIPEIPKTTPQVPDVTLYSPNNRLQNKNNFLQRTMSNEKVLNIPKQQPTRNLHNPLLSNPNFNSEMHMRPSVPDVSFFNPQALIPTSRMNGLPTNTKSPSNLVFNKSNKNYSKENVFGKPSVPDVTILEEDNSQIKQQSQQAEPVFSESYKKMLINSHEQFMKQLKADKPPSAEQTNPSKRKSSLFNSHANKYQENPLRKYAPLMAQQKTTKQDQHNSSSILVDLEESAQPSGSDKSDEKTFKKVSEMLNKIEKLVIPGQSAPDKMEQAKPDTNVKTHEIMRHLASTHLSPEEFAFYDVENDLKELGESDDEDNSDEGA